ncbi:membrane protein [Marinomonas sp. S3726]|uniref:DMT family transporter n=1 Tax=Marinomonas sp. S3726 TaxID=579484 RepID=UPI0005F9FC14|nr:multidrug efflux SMR transporter [Marinomonas sp. S3726]KJZ14681.1 membrane protein [Marinomonas sp. S3726]
MSGWTLLIIGICFEVVGSLCLKLSHGFHHLVPSILSFCFFALALTMINLSVKTLDISTAYAVWSGAGIVIITFIGTIWFAEQFSLAKFVFISLILIGVFGLHQVSTKTVKAESGHVHSIK